MGVTFLPPEDDIVKEIKQKMQELGMTQKELSKELTDKLGLDHSMISDILREDKQSRRLLRYGEAKNILDKLNGYLSLVPDEPTIKFATQEIEYAYLDEPLPSVAQRMYEEGWSQLPVKDVRGDRSRIVGTLTERSFLRYLLRPPSVERQWRIEPTGRVGSKASKGKDADKPEKRGTIVRGEVKELKALKVRNLQKYLEDTPGTGPQTSLKFLSPDLDHFYAALVHDGPDLVGIITRADILKVFF